MPRLFASYCLCASFVLTFVTSAIAAEPAGPLSLWLPGQSWAIKVEGASYVVTEREVSLGSRSTRFFGEDRAGRVMVSGFIEPASREGDALVVRQVMLDSLKRSPLPPKDITTWESDGFACAQYSTAVGGMPDFRQTSVHAYAVRGAYWIDIHFSSMDPKADLKRRAENVSVAEGYKPTDQDRAAAIAPIKRLESQLSLPENAAEAKWKDLAVKLAVAYRDAGQLVEVRRILQRGLARYPGYAIFHYRLACADAEAGDADSAMANLGIAWRNRNGLAPNEALPDPLRDPSFAGMLKDARYRQMLIDLTSK